MAQDSRPTEYGGKPGVIQRTEDGHTPDAQEQSMILRTFGRVTDTEHFDPRDMEEGPMGPQLKLGVDGRVINPARDRAIEKMNGYDETAVQ